MVKKTLNLELLQAFVIVAETKQLNLAAQKLNVTASAVSQSIRKLEWFLQTELFYHDQRPIKLTPAGRRLLRDGIPILQAALTLQNDFSRMEASQLSLRLGLSETITATISPWLVGEIQGQVGELEIYSGLNVALTQLLKEEKLDICLYSDGLLDENRWERMPIYEEIYIGVSASSINYVESIDQLKKLAATRPYICYTTDSYDRKSTDMYLKRVGIEPRTRIQTSSSYCLVGLIEQTKGWSILPPTNLWTATLFAQKERFWPLPDTNKLIRRTWALGRESHKGEIRWVAELTRQIFSSHVLPELIKQFPTLSGYVYALPEC